MNTLEATLMRILTHPSSNEVDKYDGYYVSYSSDAYGCESQEGETALVVDDNFYILNGDWRKAYRGASECGGLEACEDMFRDLRPLYGSSWSD